MLQPIYEIAKLIAKVPTPVRNVIVDIVRNIATAPEDERMARAQRALEESARVEAFDRMMAARKPRT